MVGQKLSGKTLIFDNGDYVFINEPNSQIKNNGSEEMDGLHTHIGSSFAIYVESCDVMRLYTTPDKILKNKIKDMFFSKWTADENIENDWNVIVTKITSFCTVALKVLDYRKYYHHLGFKLNFDQKEIGFILYDINDREIFECELFNENELIDFLRIEPVSRFNYLLNMLRKKMSIFFNEFNSERQ